MLPAPRPQGVPEKVVQLTQIARQPLVERREGNRHRLSQSGLAHRPKKLPESRLPDLVLRDLRRLRRQREEGEEIATSCRVRAQAPLELPQGILVIEQGHD